MESKPFWQSKTLWANMAIAAWGMFVEAAPDSVEWVAFANMVLRYFTNRAVSV